MAIFSFAFIGIFAVILSTMPSGYLIAGWENDYQTDKTAATIFKASNITAYSQTNTTLLNRGTSQMIDAGLAPGHYIELWWDNYLGRDMFQVRHAWEFLFGTFQYEILELKDPYREQAGLGDTPRPKGIEKVHLVNLWENEVDNASYAEWGYGGYRAQTLIFIANTTRDSTIGESWDSTQLNVTLGYEFDFNQTQLNAFNFFVNLMLFRAPNLGIGDTTVNYIMNAVIAIPLYIMIAVCVVKIALAIMPFGSGVND